MRFAGDHAGDLRVPPESTHHGPAVPGHRYPRAVATGLCERAADATRPLCVRNWRTRSASAHVRRTAPCDGQRAVGKRPGDRLARLLLPPPRAGQGLLHRVLEGLADRHRLPDCRRADRSDLLRRRHGRRDRVAPARRRAVWPRRLGVSGSRAIEHPSRDRPCIGPSRSPGTWARCRRWRTPNSTRPCSACRGSASARRGLVRCWAAAGR